ncbi:MAG: hypothetical protein Q9M76_02705 [Candidatus Dojkabacteria bacterium]|nr:hypothetical protein [Candidatus Dojkabacteria bacterium]
MSYQEFIANQDLIYRDIQSQHDNIQSTGVHSNLSENKLGLISLSYSDSFSKELSILSKEFSTIIPSTVYSSEMIHTTVSVIKKFDENSLKSISKVIIDLDINKYNISFNFEKNTNNKRLNSIIR